MQKLYIDFKKHGIEYLEDADIVDATDDDIVKLAKAFSAEYIAPIISGLRFEPETVKQIMRMFECKRCGKCCRANSKKPDDPGVMVGDYDLELISKHTKHSLKSLKNMSKINTDPRYSEGARYLSLPCLFYNKNEKSCKIYPYRPFICKIYPVSDSPEHFITIDVQCDAGKSLYQKTMKYIREQERQKRSKL